MPNFTEPDELARERKTMLDVRSAGTSRGALLQARGFEARALNGGYPAWLALNPEPDEGHGE